MKFGFFKADMTPGMPVPLAGFFGNRISTGINDKLFARALFFHDDGKMPVIILQLDLLYIDQICRDKIRNSLKEISNFKNCSLLVCCTHTHSGFGGIFDMDKELNRELSSLLGESNPALIDLVVKKSLEAINGAAANCIDTTIRISHGIVDGVATNRRRIDIPCDNSLFIIEFHRSDEKKVLLYSLSCHPTVLSGENLLISGDFPGAVASRLEAPSGSYDMAVFFNGSAGDMSTRFTRKESSFKECERFASIIIDAINNTQKGDFKPLQKIELNYHAISLRMAESFEPQQARANLQNAIQILAKLKSENADLPTIKKAISQIEGAQMTLLKLSCLGKDKLIENKTVKTGILKINDTVVVCSPFELFSSLALILKKKKQVVCFGYANEHFGYLADRDAWDHLDYEALSGDFAQGEGERYIELVSELL